MNRVIKVTMLVAGLAAAGLVGYGAGKVGAHAQGGPAMMGQSMGPGMRQGMMMGERSPGAGPRADGMHRHHMRGGQHGPGPFAGFFINRDNKNLTNDDVRKIAEAGLLWFGERGWKIGEVKDAGSRTAEFALTTENGGVIARFTMDRDTGRVRRIA
jgi:hypothetical protein